jgi:hypothetical protein
MQDLTPNLCNKIKHYRRIFARYEKTSRNDMGMLRFVSALIRLR